MTTTAESYRAALRRHPAGVAIITLMSETGPVGFTATSFASLSLDPPLVSFNITHTSSSIAALREAEALVVHLVGTHQLEVARRFSRSAEHRFADRSLWTTTDTGEPLLDGTSTWLRITPVRRIAAGDSDLIIGAVADVHVDDTSVPSMPLLYHNGTYRQFAEIDTRA